MRVRPRFVFDTNAIISVVMVVVSLAACTSTGTPAPEWTATSAPPTAAARAPTARPSATPSPTVTASPSAGLPGTVLVDDLHVSGDLLAIRISDGGSARLSIEAQGEFAAAADSATILHALRGRILRVDLSSGTETLLVELEEGAEARDLRFSPDGSELAFTDRGAIYVMDVATGQAEQLLTGASTPYSGGLTGHCTAYYLTWTEASKLVFYAGSTLPAVITASGEPGSHVTVDCDDRVWREIDTRTGAVEKIDRVGEFSEKYQRVLEEQYNQGGRLSPDGLGFAFLEQGMLSEAQEDGTVRKLGIEVVYGFEWSPDGRHLVSSGGPGGDEELWIVPMQTGEPPLKLSKRRCVPRLWAIMSSSGP